MSPDHRFRFNVILIIFCIFSTFINANAALSQININANAKAFDPSKVNGSSGKMFKLSKTGIIEDGPRRMKGEPIDYSSIYSAETLARLFTFSVLTCIEGTQYCDQPVFKLPTKKYRFLLNRNRTKVIIF